MPPIPRAVKWLVAALGLLTAALPCGARAAPPAPPELEAMIDTYLAPVLRTNNFAGVVLIARGDDIIFQKGYGFANLEHRVAHRPDTLFHIASVSKPFTAAAIMLLAEQGAIDLHAPLSRILPDFPNGEVLTIHHLLTHMSGIPNINDFAEYEEIQFHRQTPQQLVSFFRDRPLEFAPGTRYRYSNSNYNLLAHIIERVSGRPYGEFLDSEIFQRVGLAHTGHPRDMSDIVQGLADGYAPRGLRDLERARYIDWSVKAGNGSLFSNAADLVRFFRAVHEGRLLDSRSMAASFTQHRPQVGYGWFITRVNGRDIHHMNGRQPGWSAQADYYVADGVTIIVLSNTYTTVATPIARAVGGIYFGEPYEPFPALSERPLAAEAVAPMLGTYQFGADYYVPNLAVTIVQRDGGLCAENSNGYPASALIPVGPTRFIMRSFWTDLEFIPAVEGRPSELRIGPFRGVRTN